MIRRRQRTRTSLSLSFTTQQGRDLFAFSRAAGFAGSLFFLALLLACLTLPGLAAGSDVGLPPGVGPFINVFTNDAKTAPTAIPADVPWKSLAPGLDMADLAFPDNAGFTLTALRLDPEKYDFALYSSAWDNAPARTLNQWAQTKTLVTAINAGMYLPDGQTSTGYMRQGEHHNNDRVAEKYGAFFVAGPRKPGLPKAAVLDRTIDDWRKLLPEYETVVQNFRLMGPDGTQIWPENGPLHAVAAVAQDKNGNILFLVCRTPVSVRGFVTILLAYNLDIEAAMYVEGGPPASMAVNLPTFQAAWTGRGAFPLPGGEPLLPNIIGAKAR